MSECTTTRQEFVLLQGLRDRGIPLDEYDLERMQAACLGLEIYEDIDFPSIAFNLPSGGAGYVLNTVVCNNSDRPLCPVHIGFDLPDWESSMRLLADPRTKTKHPKEQFRNSRKNQGERREYLRYMTGLNLYEFPQTPLHEYERDAVLNHCIGPGRKLYPGEYLEGLFMAVGENAIPWSYRDRHCFDIDIIVFDQKGQSSRGTFRVMVERTIKEKELMKKLAKLRESRSHEKLVVAAD